MNIIPMLKEKNLFILNAVEHLEDFEEMLLEFKHLFKC